MFIPIWALVIIGIVVWLVFSWGRSQAATLKTYRINAEDAHTISGQYIPGAYYKRGWDDRYACRPRAYLTYRDPEYPWGQDWWYGEEYDDGYRAAAKDIVNKANAQLTNIKKPHESPN